MRPTSPTFQRATLKSWEEPVDEAIGSACVWIDLEDESSSVCYPLLLGTDH